MCNTGNIVSGKEDGVPWLWVGSLDLTYDGVQIAPHPIHGEHVASLGGNEFYGSFTVLYSDGAVTHYGEHIYANPTPTKHTEPQYFEWLDNHLGMFMLVHASGRRSMDDSLKVKAIIIEMAQTNTPCSKATCRKEILARVKTGLWGDVVYLARLSAFQRYDSQPPRVGLSYAVGKRILKSAESAVLSEPSVVHKVPDSFN